MNKLSEKILNATKWSMVTEIAAKFIVPITNMILARLLTPEAFGVVATITMVTSFAEMFADAGFQKYLVQHEFKNNEAIYKNANVAFLSNLSVSLFLWGIITLNRDSIAALVGNPGLGNVIAIACISLPLTALSSIQMSLYRRNFDYKTLFLVRVIGIFIPLFITVPLALIGVSYWAIIAGTICGNVSNAIILTVKSKWKPSLSFNISLLKEMLSFSIWSLLEAIAIWLTNWIDIFVVGSLLNEYYLGLYKTAPSTVGGIMGLVTGATTSILFSTLSRLQNDEIEYNRIFLKFQKIVGILVLPMGVGIYVYRGLITAILLGSQWREASLLIGLWGLTSSIMILFGSYCSEVYRSKGRPKLSLLAQILHLIVLVPACYFGAQQNFDTLVWIRSLVRLQLVIVHFIIMYSVIKISPWAMIANNISSSVCSLAMGVLAIYLQKFNSGLIWTTLSIIMCIMFYSCCLMLFPSIRREIIMLIVPKITQNNWKLLLKLKPKIKNE